MFNQAVRTLFAATLLLALAGNARATLQLSHSQSGHCAACASGQASITEIVAHSAPPLELQTQLAGFGDADDTGGIALAPPKTTQLNGFNIVINAAAGLAGNAAALAAFERAAQQWEAVIADPILVTINADFLNLGSSSILGQASSVVLTAGYTTIRNSVVTDAADEADDTIVSSLPTSAQFSAVIPAGFSLNGNVDLTKANAKALGFANIDINFGVSDATIQFNSGFNFDFDNSNGVTAGFHDFETVAVHEIGHALGFISVVDDVNFFLANNSTSSIAPTTLDLFRFQNNVANRDPATAGEFTLFPRFLTVGSDAITDQVFAGTADAENRMSTGSTTSVGGDGRQASHWKDNNLSGLLIGVMDPTQSSGNSGNVPISFADLRALDLIGWDINTAAQVIVPLPVAFGPASALLAALALRRPRRQS